MSHTSPGTDGLPDQVVQAADGQGAQRRLGALMRRERKARGLRQADVADTLLVERSNISQFETGARLPSLDYIRRWQSSYGTNPEILSAYQAAVQEHDLELGTRKSRRDIALPLAGHPTPDEGSGTPEAARSVVRALSDSTQAGIHLARRLWHADGDASALDALTLLTERLEKAVPSSSGELRRQALRLLGYTHEAMGCRAFDSLNFVDAIRHFHQMHELGTELTDPDLTCLAIVHLGDISRRRRQYAGALRLLDASEPHTRHAASATRGRRWQILARVYAECSDEVPFLHAIDQAEDCVERGSRTNSFDAIEIRHERAQGLTLLGNHRAALAIYEETGPIIQLQGVRARACFTILKAQALAHGEDLNEGIRLALQGLALVRSYDSPRHASRVQRLYDRLLLGHHGTDPRLSDLHDALSAA